MIFSELKQPEEVKDLPFSHLIKDQTKDGMTYLINNKQETIGFITVEELEPKVFKLDKFVISKPKESEELIEIFYHILELVEQSGAEHLVIESKQSALIELLNWLGFKRWPELDATYGYTYG